MKKELAITLLTIVSSSTVSASAIDDAKTYVNLSNLQISETGTVLVDNKEVSPAPLKPKVPLQPGVPGAGKLQPGAGKLQPGAGKSPDDSAFNLICGKSCDESFNKKPGVQSPGVQGIDSKPIVPNPQS